MGETKKEFAQRLTQAMLAAGYPARPSVLEREFNARYWGKPMTLHGVRRWLLGETLPSQNKLLVLAEWLRVEPQDLIFGRAIQDKVARSRRQWEQAIGYEERDVFEAFLRLPAPQRRIVREVILAFARAHGPIKEPGAR